MRPIHLFTHLYTHCNRSNTWHFLIPTPHLKVIIAIVLCCKKKKKTFHCSMNNRWSLKTSLQNKNLRLFFTALSTDIFVICTHSPENNNNVKSFYDQSCELIMTKRLYKKTGLPLKSCLVQPKWIKIDASFLRHTAVIM